MKAQGRDEIENLFRKGLGGYESEPDGHVWNAIQKGIKKSRRKFLWKILLPSVLLVAALGAWGVFYINENKNINGLTGKTGQAEGKSYNNSADAGFSESHTGHGDTGSPDLTGSGNFGNTPGYSDGAVNKKITTKKHTKKKGNTAGDGTFDQETAGNSAGSLTDTVPAVVENDLFDKDTVVEKTVKKDTIRSRRASDEKNKPVLTRRFTASLYARPVWTTLPHMLNNRALPPFIQPKNINLKMAAGIGLQYQLGKRLFVSAGFEYFRAEQDLHYTTYKYVQSSKTVKTISTDRKIQNEILRWETLVPDKNHTFTNVFESFNYPLHAAYSVFATEKCSITAMGGIALTRVRWRSYDINDSTYYTGIAAELVQKQQYISVSAGVCFNYFINSRFTAFINPTYGFLGKDLSQKRRNYGPKNQYYSVSAGIGFKF